MKKLMIIAIIFMLLIGCNEKTIKVGFIADLSTKNSQLGVDARNAVILLVDQVNEAGGINGKHIELVIKDDESNLEVAKVKHDEFLAEKVHLVIGHLTSNMAEVMIESNSEDLMFVAPSISTDSLSMIDDYILRTSPINSNQAKTLAEYLLKHDIKEYMVVYDLHNKEYTENLLNQLSDSYEDDIHHITFKLSYDSSKDDLENIAKKISITNDSHVLFITQATDTAYFLQYLRKDNPYFHAYSVSWSMTYDLIQKGGPAVENTIFVGISVPEIETDNFKIFKSDYENRFGYKPSFISVLSYDAAKVLLQGIEEAKTDRPKKVKDSIIDLGSFSGINETFEVDQYGDNNRQYLLYILKDKEFIPFIED